MENTPYDLGDLSFHVGWTFHRAGAHATERLREVMTMIYMDENIRVSPPKNKNHMADMERWMPGLMAGSVLASHLTPVVYSSSPAPIADASIA